MDSSRAGKADVVVPVGSGLKAVTALAHAKRSAGSPERDGAAVALGTKWNADKEVSELSEMDADMERLKARRAAMQAELYKERERQQAMIAQESAGKAPTDTAAAGDDHPPEHRPAEHAHVAVSKARSEFTRAEYAAPGYPEINEADLSRLARGDRVQSSSVATSSSKPYYVASDPASMKLAEKFKYEWMQKLGLESSDAATESPDDGSSSGT